MTNAADLFGPSLRRAARWTLEALRTAIGAADFETVMAAGR